MRCPICRKSVTWEGNPFRPFCSERCKLIDLDNWLAGRYRISAPVDTREKNASVENPGPNTKGDRD
jgi:endogenous inhibitor of DNA gyrase (YacG/DUF329 family)